MKPTPVLVPKETVSDETYRLVRLRCADGTFVSAGAVICELETSKALLEVTSAVEGYVFFAHPEGADVPVGSAVAWVCREPVRPAAETSPTPASLPTVASVRISKSAQALMERHGLTAADFVGHTTVTTANVEARIRDAAGEEKRPVLALRPEFMNIAILGGGGHAKVCIELIRATGEWHIVGILDSIQPIGSEVMEVPVIGRDTDADLQWLRTEGVQGMVNGIGLVENHRQRATIHARLRNAGLRLPNLIHPSAIIEPSSSMGSGNQIMAGAIVGSEVKIGDGCIINTGSIVSHDCRIGNDVHLAPGSILAGAVVIGDRSLVGMGSTVFLRVRIGQDAVIPNGTTVTRDVSDREVMRGVHTT
ncbi:MAG: hypothetical protein FJY37_09165 [Betaproteobacteria bacterium]|nr:hypothetical protein [Betaproteobacteria bacterium]